MTFEQILPHFLAKKKIRQALWVRGNYIQLDQGPWIISVDNGIKSGQSYLMISMMLGTDWELSDDS